MNIRVGDKVKLLQVPPAVQTIPENELNTKKVFEECIGKVFTVKSIDKHGHLEFELPNLDSIWVEPQFVSVVSGGRK